MNLPQIVIIEEEVIKSRPDINKRLMVPSFYLKWTERSPSLIRSFVLINFPAQTKSSSTWEKSHKMFPS